MEVSIYGITLLAVLHLLSIPLAIIYSHILEWVLHKYVLHGLGKNKKSLWDLIQEMALYKKKRLLKINFQILNKILPSFIKKILIKNSSILQQIIIIDHTKYTEEKKYL